MKGKNNSKSTNKSPNKNLKQDEMKKNPILPNKKGNGKKDVVKEEPKPKKIELPIIENNQIDKKEKLKKERELRLKREKENEKKDQEIFEKILEEAKNNHYKPQSIRTKISNTEEVMPTMKISERKAQSILEKGGMLDAYKYLIAQLCKNGLPTGNLFDYSAYVIQSYEKKWKEKKSKEAKEKLEKYWKQKEQALLEKTKAEEIDKKNLAVLNRSIEEIHMKKYIKSLDRSRSTKRIKEPRSTSKLREGFDTKELLEGKQQEKNNIVIEQGNKNSKDNNSSKLPPIKTNNQSSKKEEAPKTKRGKK